MPSLDESLKILKAKEAEFEALATNAPIWIIRVSKDGILEYINHVLPEFNRDEVIGTSAYNYMLPEFHEDYKNHLNHVIQTGEIRVFEQRSPEYGEGFFQWELRMAPIKTDDGIHSVVVITTDVTEQVLAREELKKSVREREALLKEVHHRTKNNLQIISSILKLHSERSDNVETKKVLNDCKNSIYSMALVHESLYQSNDFSQIDLAGYVDRFCEHLNASLLNAEEVVTNKDLQPVQTSMEKAVTIGLILNELLTNAMKHAFPSGKGNIWIKLEKLDKKARLSVSDDGIGFDPDKSERNLGFDLMQAMIEQLEGENRTDSIEGKGTTQIVEFPI